MTKLLKNLWKDENGASAIEYALIAGLCGLAIIVGATALGKAVGDKYSEVGSAVGSAG